MNLGNIGTERQQMNLVERVRAILLSPHSEWPVIDSERGDAAYLLTNYVALLAAVPAVASFIGYSAIGLSVGRAFVFGIFTYIVYCMVWWIEAYVIDWLAASFGGQRDFPSALKLAAYSSTPAWLAGIFQLIPALSILGILGLYSLYLLWTGLPVLMKCPRDKALVYTIAIVGIIVVIMIIVMAILAALLRPF
jgi:hypothetical protein